MRSYPGGMNMKKVSFIMKRAVMLAFVLTLVTFLPLPNNFLSNNTAVAKASEKTDLTSDARLTYTSLKLVVDNTRALSVRNVDKDEKEYATFKSSDSSIVSVKKNTVTKATLTAVGVGDAAITVTVRDAKKKVIKTLTCKVTVGPPAQSVKFAESEVTIKLSDESAATILKAIVKPGNTEEKPKISVSEASSEEDIILVSDEASVNNGIATVTVKPVAIGTIKITITIDNGISDTCIIQVVE